MAIDPNIKKKADDIRNKIYGKEVRESLASGLEEMSSDVVGTVGRQDEVEGQFQSVIENTTDKDVISAPEIIAARDGETNLKARLDKENQEVTSQLAHTDNKFEFVSINDFPRLPLENEDSARINRAFNSISEGIVQLYGEEYETTSPIKLKRDVTLKGIGNSSTIIKNTNGTNIIETIDTEIRHYHIGVYDILLDGVGNLGQIGLYMPHVSHSFFQNVLVKNVDIGIKITAKKEDGTVTGAYYNNFINPIINNTNIGIQFIDIANDNKIYGGKVNASNIGIWLGVNNTGVFGTALEANHEYHAYLTGYNNSFYGVRFEGYDTCVGIYNEGIGEYANYIFAPHFQSLKASREIVSGELMVFGDGGLFIPTRTDSVNLHSKKNAGGTNPMVYMEELVNGNRAIYKSKKTIGTGNHIEGVDRDDEPVFRINSYGEYVNYTPNRGMYLTSPDETLYAVRVNNSGTLVVTPL